MSGIDTMNAPSCRICNADPSLQKVRAATVFGGREEHNFWHCEQCDAVYLYPVPTEEEETRFYRNEFERFMSKRSGPERDWSNAEDHIRTNQDQVARRLAFLEPYISSKKDLLEIGCSSGFMLNALRDRTGSCVGVEPSGVFLDFLKEKGYEAYSSLEALERNSDRKFDLITHFFVLEHIRNPFLFFQQTMALLKEGGVMIAEVPCVNDPLTSLYPIPAFEKFYWSVAHHFYYSPKSLAFVLDSLDLRYEMVPEQRYDLSNHIVWMTEGRPGGQGRFQEIFSNELINRYKEDLKARWLCDTILLYVFK